MSLIKGKNGLILILLTLIELLSFSIQVLIEVDPEKEKTPSLYCLRYHTYDPKTHSCIHDGFFPLDSLKLLELAIVIITSMISTSSGVGGGVIYSTTFLYIEQFEANKALPLTSFIILLCSLSTFIMGVMNKMKNKNQAFVDYKFSCIMLPFILIGSKIGSVFNQIFPNALTNTVFWLVQIYITHRIYKNSMELYKEELRKEAEGCLVPKEPEYTDHELEVVTLENYGKYMENLERREQDTSGHNKSRPNPDNINQCTLEEAIDFKCLKVLCGLLLLVVLDQVLEGNNKIHSAIGVIKCSNFFWFLFFGFCFACIYAAYYNYNQIYVEGNSDERDSLTRTRTETTKEANIKEEIGKNIYLLFTLSFFGGIIIGTLCIGNGFLIIPLMLALGFDPKTVVTTSNLLIIFSSLSNTVIFTFSGQIETEYALIFLIPSLASAIFGNYYINEYINRTGKKAFLLFINVVFCVLSLFLLPIITLQYASYLNSIGQSVFKFASYCNK